MSAKKKSMSDLDTAKQLLQKKGVTCALVCGDKEFVSEQRGIASLLEYVEKDINLNNFSAADKIVGKAAVLLYVYLGVKCVYAQVLSVSAEEVLRKNGIYFEYEVMTENIINRRGDGICPMEQTVLNIGEPKTAVLLLREKINNINNIKKPE